MSSNDSTSGHATRATTAHSDGAIAEGLAARFLEQHGLTVLARNYRCRGGEVDLICRERRVLVFVEVRLRRSASHGGAVASITAVKQDRIMRAAQHYLHAQRSNEADCRFDCILLVDLSETSICLLYTSICV